MSGLRECPFCGGGETTTSVNRLNRAPSMSGKESAIISVEVHHWCAPVEGQPNRNTITRTGRDMDSAIAAWNRRAPSSITREEVARLVEAAQEARNAIQDAENEEPGSEDWGALCGARLSLTAALAPFTTPRRLPMSENITLNGIEYTPVVKTDGNRAVIVVDRGWIFAGDVTRKEGRIYLTNAVWLFRGEKVGFAALIASPKANAVIRKIADLDIPAGAEVFCVPVPAGWGV